MADVLDQLSFAQRDLMRHALGLDQAERAYRNFYVTNEHDPSVPQWRDLVARGLAAEGQHSSGGKAQSNSLFFAVTDAGCDKLGVTDLSGLEERERFRSGLRIASETGTATADGEQRK